MLKRPNPRTRSVPISRARDAIVPYIVLATANIAPMVEKERDHPADDLDQSALGRLIGEVLCFGDGVEVDLLVGLNPIDDPLLVLLACRSKLHAGHRAGPVDDLGEDALIGPDLGLHRPTAGGKNADDLELPALNLELLTEPKSLEPLRHGLAHDRLAESRPEVTGNDRHPFPELPPKWARRRTVMFTGTFSPRRGK